MCEFCLDTPPEMLSIKELEDEIEKQKVVTSGILTKYSVEMDHLNALRNILREKVEKKLQR